MVILLWDVHHESAVPFFFLPAMPRSVAAVSPDSEFELFLFCFVSSVF